MNKHKTDPIYIDLYIEKKMKEMKQNFSTDERTPCREEWKTNWNLVTSDSLGCVFKEDSFGILLTGACTYFVSLVLPLVLYFFLFFSILCESMVFFFFLFFLFSLRRYVRVWYRIHSYRMLIGMNARNAYGYQVSFVCIYMCTHA